jgi:hypothetical protein
LRGSCPLSISSASHPIPLAAQPWLLLVAAEELPALVAEHIMPEFQNPLGFMRARVRCAFVGFDYRLDLKRHRRVCFVACGVGCWLLLCSQLRELPAGCPDAAA